MMSMIEAAKIEPQKLMEGDVTGNKPTRVLTSMNTSRDIGISVIDRF